jgi:DNA polymerase alpha-associated DNA helicase A
MKRTVIVAALKEERGLVQKGMGYTAVEAEVVDGLFGVSLRGIRGMRSSAVDDGLEGARAVWGDTAKGDRGTGYVKFVDASRDRVFIQPLEGNQLPKQDLPLWLYEQDFLSPLINLWESDVASKRALRRVVQCSNHTLVQPGRQPSSDFDVLRERQARAIQLPHHRVSLLLGPPGTGKTFTLGSIVAHLLTRFNKSRIMLVGPTNVAVDTALISADEWLVRVKREDLRPKLRRLGTYFDPKKYIGRDHLLAPGVADAAQKLLILYLEEPSRSDVKAYANWKDKVDEARAALKADVLKEAQAARLVAMTASSAFQWNDAVAEAGPWSFVICDEASQVIQPAAIMLAGMAQQAMFAGDPNQLAPIVQSTQHSIKAVLEKTAFDCFNKSPIVQLNEQSRMTKAICDVVGHLFYDGDLKVCKRAETDRAWKEERSPWFVNGREVPRILFQEIRQPATWSQRYGGFIRFKSAELIKLVLDQLANSLLARASCRFPLAPSTEPKDQNETS